MNRPRSNLSQAQGGQTLLEFLFVLPPLLIIFFAMIQYTFILFSQRIVDWACFTAVRQILVSSENNHSRKISVEQNLLHMIRVIPFQKGISEIDLSDTSTEVTVRLLIPIHILGFTHELQQKVTLFR